MDDFTRIVQHTQANNDVIYLLFQACQSRAEQWVSGQNSVQAGRDGLRYYIHRRKFLEIYPRPNAYPPHVGLWADVDQSRITDLRHPEHAPRKDWFSLIRAKDMARILKLIDEAAQAGRN